MPRKAQEAGAEPSLKDVISSLNGLVTAVKEIRKDVDSLKTPSASTVNVSVENKLSVENSEVPIPQEYREIVNKTLNKSFGIRISPRSDIPAFEFIVITPPKYQNAGVEYLKTYKEQLHPKVVSYGEGSNGVKEWCETVLSSFSPDTRAMIATDRARE